MTVRTLLRDNLGIVTRRMLRAEGVTDHKLRRWIADGQLIPVSRSVVARPWADPALVRAVALGGRLACVSAARLRGIWVVDDGRLHVAFRANHSHFVDDGVEPRPRAHWDSAPLDPLGDLIYLESGLNML
ncbi:type IV toxin-antitoxin system AbiEi family antitoxin domain-containing protein [Gryllotalpicola ginsengisoli]|uniref:type IV toxin-antitoxin system AbiEi family antitoxin domain-containing protein n=1 Tax=Gryllotalpicola ginsengisoli TaxID=444608 RepID=UPI0003B66524|nr:type IV toxin-antitoxin system AbiEi family antitoxin domain-containing protein [Gryllotalpicola ginsengisoli]